MTGTLQKNTFRYLYCQVLQNQHAFGRIFSGNGKMILNDDNERVVFCCNCFDIHVAYNKNIITQYLRIKISIPIL